MFGYLRKRIIISVVILLLILLILFLLLQFMPGSPLTQSSPPSRLQSSEKAMVLTSL